MATRRIADRKCLYTSGFGKNFDNACDDIQDDWVKKNLLPAIAQLPPGKRSYPELHLAYYTFPAHHRGKIFLQRNLRSGKVRAGTYFDEDQKSEAKNIYNNTFNHMHYKEILAALQQLGDTEIVGKINNINDQIQELENQRNALIDSIILD